jgi:hypothetical protein
MATVKATAAAVVAAKGVGSKKNEVQCGLDALVFGTVRMHMYRKALY